MAHSDVTIDGSPDSDYLQMALARGGITAPINKFGMEQLTGGRTGAQVDKLSTEVDSYILKRVPYDNWQQTAMGAPGEGPLWISGALDDQVLPTPLQCPAIDVAFHDSSQSWWILMRDVGAGIPERNKFGEEETRKLWSAVARLHAHYWGRSDELAELPLAEIRKTTDVFAEPVYGAIDGLIREPWVEDVIRDFMPLRVLLPAFLELLPSSDGDFYLQMVKDRSWHRGLEDATPTFIHGDLRRANVSFMDDKTILFDWEFAAQGPAACDLQWNSFLTYWAYTPGDGIEPWDRDHLRDCYLSELETALGHAIDRIEFQKTWDLAWLRIMSQLGFCFADINRDNVDELAAANRRIQVAVQNCRRILGG